MYRLDDDAGLKFIILVTFYRFMLTRTGHNLSTPSITLTPIPASIHREVKKRVTGIEEDTIDIPRKRPVQSFVINCYLNYPTENIMWDLTKIPIPSSPLANQWDTLLFRACHSILSIYVLHIPNNLPVVRSVEFWKKGSYFAKQTQTRIPLTSPSYICLSSRLYL